MSDTAGLSLTAQAADGSRGSDAHSNVIVSPLIHYVGVLDFTAPQYTVSVPQSLLRALHVSDGAKLRLTNVHLSRAMAVTLRPLTRGWARLPELERRALLEFQLRRHTFLVQDSELSFSYHAHLPTFRFRVVETKPEPVVSITDTDIATEILPFEEDASMLDEERETAAAGSSSQKATAAAASSSTAAASSTSAFPVPAGHLPKLTADESVTGRVAANLILRFEYSVSDPNTRLTIQLKSSSGEADLYVLSSGDAEAQNGVDVEVDWFTWNAQGKGASKSLTFSAADARFGTGTMQIGVRAYGADAEFSLVVHESNDGSKGVSAGYQLGSISASISPSTDPAAAVPADSTVCPTCRAVISSKALAMHSVQCARLNCVCKDCGAVMKTSEREKHTALAHATYTCLCGVQLQQAAMVEHRRNVCALRLCSCLYCPLKLVVAERGAHQHECGNLRSHCIQCGEHIQRKTMRRHLVKAHGGVNGKTDERDIGWQDFWM